MFYRSLLMVTTYVLMFAALQNCGTAPKLKDIGSGNSDDAQTSDDARRILTASSNGDLSLTEMGQIVNGSILTAIQKNIEASLLGDIAATNYLLCADEEIVSDRIQFADQSAMKGQMVLDYSRCVKSENNDHRMQARVVYRIEITMPGCTYSDAPALSKYMRAITQSSTLSCLKSGATGSMYINIFNTYKVQPSGTHVMASEQDYSTGRLLASNQLKPCTITKDIQGRMLITDCQLIIKSYHPNQRSIYEDKLAQADANESKAIVSRLKFNDVLYEADVNDPVAGTLGIQVNQYLGRMAFIEDKAAATMRLVQNRNVYEFVYQNGKFETTAN